MPKPKKRKTRDELIQSGIKMYSNLPQFKAKLASGEWSEEDVFIKASDWADEQIRLREERLAGEAEVREVVRESDQEYRDRQEEAYRQMYAWEGANDEASLQHLLNLEVIIKQIQADLEKANLADEKKDLRKSMAETTREHRTLQEKLGIDRLSRQKAESARSTIDDWDRIKKEAKQKLDDLASEFDSKASNVSTEAELRDRMKYHFAIPFDMVDSVLVNHRRVLGLDLTVDKS